MNVTIPCPCPPKSDGGTRHTQDTVTLRETLDFRTVGAIRNAVLILPGEDRADQAYVLAILTEAYVLAGIEAWSLVDAKGKPVPVDRGAIRTFLAEHPELGVPIGDAADELYQQRYMAPLLWTSQTSSPDTPTDESTSAGNGSSETPPRPLRRSSTTTSRTADTEQISA